MKKRFLLITLMMCILGGINLKTLNAQITVEIGDKEGGTSSNVPVRTYGRYSLSQTIYDISSQISSGSEIESIAYYVTESGVAAGVGSQDLKRKITIYISEIQETTFNGTTTLQVSGDDLVYDDWCEFKEDAWTTIELNTPRTYNGGKLMICVYDATNGYTWNHTKFKTTYNGNNVCLRTESDNNNPASGTYTGIKSPQIPNIQLTYTEGTSTTPTAPDAPALTSPANGATDVFNPALNFTLGNHTEHYQILMGEGTNEMTAVTGWVEKTNNTVSYQTNNLKSNTAYSWKVVARCSDGGTGYLTTESEGRSFTTLALPTAPTLVSPTNETTGVINPTLQFTLSDNTTQYQILLDKNENPTTVVKEGTYDNVNVSYQTSKLDAGATYYWKVIAKNGAGEAESNIYQFTTSNIFPVTEYEIKLNGNNIKLEWQYADQEANQYQVCFGETEQDIVICHNPEWVPREKTVDENYVKDGSFTIKDADFGDKVYFRVNVRKDEGDPVKGATAFFVVLDEEQEWDDSYNNANDVFVRANVSVATNITAKNITIENGGILKIITNVVLSANTLVVNEGGQFFAANTATYFPINTVKFNKNIANPDKWEANNKTGWQFISSPFKDASISSFIPGEGEGDYDLYKYDGSADKQWVNHKESGLGEEFAQGIGYLASYQTKDNLTLTGSINRTNKLVIGQYGMMETQGIYLLGNPFLFNMDWEKISANGAYGINATSFVVVKADGAYEYKTSGEIKVGEGFFVLTTNDWASFNYTFKAADIVAAPSSKSRNAEQSKSLNIIATGNAGNDNVVVNFNGEGEGFPKLQNFNDAIATVYVQNNDANYGIYNCDENTTEVELCFNANQMGNYTISVEPTGEFSSIVLVDRFTGIETNLLVEDYRFTAMSEENNNRFFIRLGNGQQSTDNSHFAYVSGEDLIIEAEGTVQIIDMMGRVVYTSNVENNNRINVSDFNNGAYVVRVINENEVKVEKVVIY